MIALVASIGSSGSRPPPAAYVLGQALGLDLVGVGKPHGDGQRAVLEGEEQALEFLVRLVAGADQPVDVDRVGDEQEVEAAALHLGPDPGLAIREFG